jgi:apolipoprotein N-acyltransferase
MLIRYPALMAHLDYETPSPDDRIDWSPILINLLLGIPVGVAIAFTYTAMTIFGAAGSLIVGCLASYAARSRPLSFAAWGGTAVGCSTMFIVIAGNWWAGNRVRDVLMVSFLFIPIVFTLPAFVGGTIVVLARR